MTATVFDPWPNPQTRCHCPNCGNYHDSANTNTFTIPAYYGMGAPDDRESRRARDLRRAMEHYDAIGASRALMLADPIPPVVRQRVAVARDPRRVHLLRCMTRRPRLSLLERVRGMR